MNVVFQLFKVKVYFQSYLYIFAFISCVFVQLRAQQDEERKELTELRNEIKSQLQLDKEVSPFFLSLGINDT